MEYQGAAQYTHQQLGSAGQSAILYSDYAVGNRVLQTVCMKHAAIDLYVCLWLFCCVCGVQVCASRYWFNYRHVANTLSIYRSVKRLGIPDR